ncbi:MAG: hypothetical protein Q8941_07030 [Bacteroidota bacterium]|nr:hypothetical protein [Bacteroidota bacterium]
MKKLFFIFLGFAFLSAGAQTVDEVIQKYAANLGGLEAFTKIKTAKMSGTFSAQGNDLPMTIRVINDKACRTDLDFSGTSVIRVYNNGKGWTQSPFGGSPVPREATTTELNDFRPQCRLASPLMDYKSRGHQVELAGQEDTEGVKAFKIKLINKDDGRTTYYYIKTDDYTLIKTSTGREINGQTATLEVLYSDLKEINGAKFFMTRMQKMNGEIFQTTKFSTIELNVPIDEKIFDMPK